MVENHNFVNFLQVLSSKSKILVLILIIELWLNLKHWDVYRNTKNIPGLYQEYTENIPGIYQESTGNIPGINQEYTGNIPGIYQEYTRNIPGIYRDSLNYRGSMWKPIDRFLTGFLSFVHTVVHKIPPISTADFGRKSYRNVNSWSFMDRFFSWINRNWMDI